MTISVQWESNNMDNSAMDFLFSRRSIRQYRPEPVAEDIIRRILAAAHAAPSAHNTQPWRFVVLQDASVRRSLAESMAEAYSRDAEADGQTPAARGQAPEAIRARNERSVARISAAPLAILACVDEGCLPSGAGRRAEGERLLLSHSVAASVQNMLLAAHAEGLGACWICAPAFCPQTVRDNLQLPERWIAEALVLIGYPAEEPRKPDGRAMDEVVQWR